ncbi:MAG: hypothetical protein R2694_19060 [Ilumatobacteraceae bacterium]
MLGATVVGVVVGNAEVDAGNVVGVTVVAGAVESSSLFSTTIAPIASASTATPPAAKASIRRLELAGGAGAGGTAWNAGGGVVGVG